MAATIEDFFTLQTENKINDKLLYYKFDESIVENYVRNIIEEPLEKFVNYIELKAVSDEIEPRDIVQFSNFDNASLILCEKIKAENDPGLKCIDIGKLLLDDGKERNKVALLKYGENHAKTAVFLGLMYSLYNTYYLSGLGYIYLKLSPEEQRKLLVRTVLRSKLVVRLYKASQNGEVDLRQFLYMLSDSTYKRRLSNIKRILNILSFDGNKKLNLMIARIKF